MMEIFIEALEPVILKENDEALIKKSAITAAEHENFILNCEAYVTLTNDNGIRDMNREHRNIDEATDVLSFPFFTAEELRIKTPGEAFILGDIVISADKVNSQAFEYGHSRERELAFLTVHGMLHLLGFDHLTEEDEKIMEAKQEEILSILNLKR